MNSPCFWRHVLIIIEKTHQNISSKSIYTQKRCTGIATLSADYGSEKAQKGNCRKVQEKEASYGLRRLAFSSVSTILDKNWCSQNSFSCVQPNNLSDFEIFFDFLAKNLSLGVVQTTFYVPSRTF